MKMQSWIEKLAAIAALFAFLVLAGPLRGQQTVTYTVTDLGTLGGSSSGAYAMNEAGKVVGFAETSNGGAQAFLWQPGTGMQGLGTLGGNDGVALAINQRGDVAGWDTLTPGGPPPPPDSSCSVRCIAFLWTQTGGMVALGTLGGTYSVAFGINDRGDVVGESDNANGQIRGFHWKNGSMSELPTLPGGTISAAFDINNEGTIAGYSDRSDGSFHAVLWNRNGQIVDLGTLPGGGVSVAIAIDELGIVTGYSSTPSSVGHAFRWTKPAGMVDLGLLPNSVQSFGSAVNELGGIAGASSPDPNDAFTVGTPVIWAGQNHMIALPVLAGSNGGAAYAINTHGNAAGQVWFQAGGGPTRAVLFQRQ
ncbi:MAG: HAF repeat-containing protein [Terriglobia bacterium]|nr:MAG: HAF repeat-containing protein [Terriglobia bacterium]